MLYLSAFNRITAFFTLSMHDILAVQLLYHAATFNSLAMQQINTMITRGGRFY